MERMFKDAYRRKKNSNPKVSRSADLDRGGVAAHSWHQFYSPALVLPVRGGKTRQRHRSDGKAADHVYSAGHVGYRLTHGLTLRGKNRDPGAKSLKFFMDTRPRNLAVIISLYCMNITDNINISGGIILNNIVVMRLILWNSI